MPIFDQGYQHWQGAISGHGLRWLAITRQGVRQQLRRRRTKWLVSVAFVPAFMLAAFLVLWGLIEQNSTILQPIMGLLQSLPEEIRSGPKSYRTAIWTWAFNTLFDVSQFFVMLLVLAVGPDLISQDLRFNAIPLYLSRPIRRIDYYLGKLGVIGFFLAAVAIAPAVAAYVLGLAFSFDLGVLKDTWHLLVGSVAYGAIMVVSAGTLMLAISSLSRNSRLVGATWVGLWIMSNVTAGVLMTSVKQEWCPLFSYTTNFDRLRDELLDMPAAREKFLGLWKSGQNAAQEAVRPRFPFFRGRGRRPPPLSAGQTPPMLTTPVHLRFPLIWSVEVLGGLFVLSAWTLSTRVKSLDRLK